MDCKISLKKKLLPNNCKEQQKSLNLVSGNKERIFVNFSLGCSSQCSYCYLPSLGLSLSLSTLEVSKADDIFSKVDCLPEFSPGRQGSILTVGCYSECLDARVAPTTLEFISKVSILGNPIQIATKRSISKSIALTLGNSQRWDGQISVFISCATISAWKDYEAGTSSPSKRFESFKELKEFGVFSALYIKPIIQDVSIHDKKKFLDIAQRYKVPIIVGGEYIKNGTGDFSPFSKELQKEANADECDLLSFFSGEVKTFKGSLSAVKELRKNG